MEMNGISGGIPLQRRSQRRSMITQSTRFSIGHRPHESAVQVLSYATLPTSPQSRHDAKINMKTVPAAVDKSGSAKYVFIPQKDDVVKQRFRLRYSPCSDAYHRELEDCVLTRVGGNVRGWERGIYSFESVERIVDPKNNLVYLERTPGSNTGILTWKIDFSSCGLVIDQVSIKVESRNLNGGDALVMLASGDTKKTISHMEGLGLVDVKEFQNAKNLVVSIHLIGETSEQQTRLFEKNILSKDEFPLDLKVTLKPPTEMYNKPIILLGLMFSNSQETTVDRRHYRCHSNSAGRGFLHINIVQGKNITHTKDGLPDPQVKCYLLPDEKNLKSCKTKRAQKCSAPIWDEYFVIDGVAQSQLRKQQLGIRVVNWHLGINKKNSLLGELRIGYKNMFDFHSLASPILTSPSEFSKERTVNERVVYSPLVRSDVARSRNGTPSSPLGTGGSQNKRTTRTDSNDSDDDVWTSHPDTVDEVSPSHPDTVDPLVKNLKRLNGTSSHDEENSNDISIHVSKVDQDNNINGIVNETNNNEETVLKESKVKPPRPPPPTRLHLTDGQFSPNGSLSPSLSPRHHADRSNPHTPDSATPDSARAIFTPTFSRLMLKLPMTPKRSRRSSWGGESELSIESPRGTKSPADHQSLQSGQWDIMIGRPKQWIYCWQTLFVGVSE